MKGIILAGGNGTRLYPATLTISKQLLPVFDKPMIYYPLSVLMAAGIREILLISTGRDLPLFQSLLGDGSAFGIALDYAVQREPRGLPQAYQIGEAFLAGGASALILGDNIFHGEGLIEGCKQALAAVARGGAGIFAYRVHDPERYGVVSFDPGTGRATALHEKPARASSPWAITGLYFCDGDAPSIARELRPSRRGETEIVDLLNVYRAHGTLDVMQLGRGFTWLDTGTHDSLHDAASFVRAIEHRQGIKIACPEEIAFDHGWLAADAVLARAAMLGRTGYADYLRARVARAG